MSILRVETPRVFKPLLAPARDKAAHGGRGSAKSHFFATRAVLKAFKTPKTRIVCIREVQRSLKESAKALIEDKIEGLKLPGFRILNDEIVTPGGGVIIFQGMKDHSAESIKSLEAFDASWVEEAQTMSERSLMMLRPTIRKDGSERWWSWNPRRKVDPVDALFRGDALPPGAIVVESNWRDNPWFPAELEADRLYDQANNPDTYGHIWEGEYVGVQKGAYYAKQLAQARSEQRICVVPKDDLLAVRTFWDLGIADSMAIWVAQFVGRSIHVLDYVEGQGQPLSYYVNWLRKQGYEDALCVLPHDGAVRDSVRAVKFEDHLRDAGFKVQTVANQGQGAAILRIEALRRLFPSMWFNAGTTQVGLDALGWYHERKDETRQIGLGPEHDWSSHAADAAGLMAIAYEAPKIKREEAQERRVYTVDSEEAHTDWMRV